MAVEKSTGEGRGGKREGAGRKPFESPLVRRTVTLPQDVIDQLEALGGGGRYKLSAGIREAARRIAETGKL